MSWLDDNSIMNKGQTPDGRDSDDNSPYDSTPIEREFVLAPAWRALKAHLGSVFKRSEPETLAEDNFSTVHITEPEQHSSSAIRAPGSDSFVGDAPRTAVQTPEAEQPGVVRYYQPDPEPSAPDMTPATLPDSFPVSAQQFKPIAEPELHPAQTFEPAPETSPEIYLTKDESEAETLSPSLHTAQIEETIPPTLEETELHYSEPEIVSDIQPIAASNVTKSDGFEPVPYTAPSFTPKDVAPLTLVPTEEALGIAENRSVATDTVLPAEPVQHSKVVAAAVQLDSWISRTKVGFVTWKKSLLTRRSNSQQELFVSPPRSKRDRVWAQTSIAAAAIALAFLMGWTAANSRKPAAATNELSTGAEGTAPAPVQNSPREAAPAPRAASSGVTLAPSTNGGVTLAPGGATAQAGGVTLLPSAPVVASAPVANSTVATEAKPSPARPAMPHRRSTSKSSGHLRRSIDGPDNEVVVHRYPAKNPNVQNTKQTAQLKKYSDAN